MLVCQIPVLIFRLQYSKKQHAYMMKFFHKGLGIYVEVQWTSHGTGDPVFTHLWIGKDPKYTHLWMGW